jgi:pimeloyl-ACP methyl ester carboxylesterase
MPIVFVHGVPETHIIWDPIRSHLSRKDVVAVDMPGFGAPLPAGFDSTKEAYAAWLIAEIEKIGEPVDLVGHDWGSLLTLRVASTRPDLIRTWTGGSGAIHPDYVWHDMARMWQTPEVGEQVMKAMTADALKAALIGAGVPQAAADEIASQIDDTMKDCILKLYRSAVNVGKEWDTELSNIPPKGLLIWGADDPYMAISYADGLARRTGATLLALSQTGHWWPLQRPAEAAAALEDHWAKM